MSNVHYLKIEKSVPVLRREIAECMAQVDKLRAATKAARLEHERNKRLIAKLKAANAARANHDLIGDLK
jgi:hypothetical protein